MLRRLCLLPAFAVLILTPGCRHGGTARQGADVTVSQPAESSSAGMVAGTVSDRGGSPLVGASVYARPKGAASEASSSMVRSTDQLGAFRFEGLAPGEYELVLEAFVEGQLVRLERGVVVAGGKQSDVDWRLEALVTVRGRMLLGGQPAPAFGYRYDLVPKDDSGKITTVLVGEDGGYSVALWPGEYTLNVFSDVFGMRAAPTPVVVAPEPPDQELALDIPAVDVRVQVEFPSGEPFQRGALIGDVVTYEDSLVSRIAIDAPAHTIPGVLPGTYQLGYAIDGRDLSGWSDPTEVGAGKENIIHIVLRQPERQAYSGTFTLPPGAHEYKFFSPPDTWLVDPLNPERSGWADWNNSLVNVPGGSKNVEGKRSLWPMVDDATGRATFECVMAAPRGDVYIRGTFNNWRIDPAWKLTPVKQHAYEVTVPMAPGRHEYKFFFASEQEWRVDPLNRASVGEGLYRNSLVEVPAPGMPQPPATAEGPRVDVEKGTVTFRLLMPREAGDVYLRGSFNNWELDEKLKLQKP